MTFCTPWSSLLLTPQTDLSCMFHLWKVIVASRNAYTYYQVWSDRSVMLDLGWYVVPLPTPPPPHTLYIHWMHRRCWAPRYFVTTHFSWVSEVWCELHLFWQRKFWQIGLKLSHLGTWFRIKDLFNSFRIQNNSEITQFQGLPYSLLLFN